MAPLFNDPTRSGLPARADSPVLPTRLPGAVDKQEQERGVSNDATLRERNERIYTELSEAVRKNGGVVVPLSTKDRIVIICDPKLKSDPNNCIEYDLSRPTIFRVHPTNEIVDLETVKSKRETDYAISDPRSRFTSDTLTGPQKFQNDVMGKMTEVSSKYEFRYDTRKINASIVGANRMIFEVTGDAAARGESVSVSNSKKLDVVAVINGEKVDERATVVKINGQTATFKFDLESKTFVWKVGSDEKTPFEPIQKELFAVNSGDSRETVAAKYALSAIAKDLNKRGDALLGKSARK